MPSRDDAFRPCKRDSAHVTRFATARDMKEQPNELTHTVISAAIAVHHQLGPGMLESPYEACLAYELLNRGCAVERQRALPLVYRGQTIDCGYRIDLLINRMVIVEVKSIERLERVHSAQLLS